MGKLERDHGTQRKAQKRPEKTLSLYLRVVLSTEAYNDQNNKNSNKN